MPVFPLTFPLSLSNPPPYWEVYTPSSSPPARCAYSHREKEHLYRATREQARDSVGGPSPPLPNPVKGKPRTQRPPERPGPLVTTPRCRGATREHSLPPAACNSEGGPGPPLPTPVEGNHGPNNLQRGPAHTPLPGALKESTHCCLQPVTAGRCVAAACYF